jgi:hypothetical protein
VPVGKKHATIGNAYGEKRMRPAGAKLADSVRNRPHCVSAGWGCARRHRAWLGGANPSKSTRNRLARELGFSEGRFERLRRPLTSNSGMSGEQRCESLRRCRSDTHEVAPNEKRRLTEKLRASGTLRQNAYDRPTLFISTAAGDVNKKCGLNKVYRYRRLCRLRRPAANCQVRIPRNHRQLHAKVPASA